MRQSLKYVAQPRIGLLAVDLGGLDQTVDLGTGGGALGRVAEQPSLAPDDKRFYCALGSVVVDR
ncbi:hypothetical protein D3C81_2104590 [compost metagenome]